jgi:hypothetical protein
MSFVDAYEINSYQDIVNLDEIELILCQLDGINKKFNRDSLGNKIIVQDRQAFTRDINLYSSDYNLYKYIALHKDIIYELIIRYDKFYNTGGNYFKLKEMSILITNTVLKQLTEHDINVLFYNGTPHQPLPYIAYLVSKYYDLEIISFLRLPKTHFKISTKRVIVTDKWPNLPDEFTKLRNGLDIEAPSSLNDSSLAQNFLLKDIRKEYNPIHYGTRFGKSFISSLISNKRRLGKSIILEILMIPWKVFRIIFVFNLLNKIINKFKIFYYKTNIDITNQRYFFYPLHYQPEATTLPVGGIFTDQLFAIQFISKILLEIDPSLLLIIKEHPATFGRFYRESNSNYRPKAFYRNISRLKNTVIVDTSISSDLLINHSLCVITISGTASFEAFARNKPVIILGESYYSSFSNVIEVINIQDLLESIKLIINNKPDYHEDFIITSDLLERMSFEYDETDKRLIINEMVKYLINKGK